MSRPGKVLLGDVERGGICTPRDDPGYQAWLGSVPHDITSDTLWRMTAYRYSLYLISKCQEDVRSLGRRREKRALMDQLLRAVGGISASLEEGYSRSSGKERAHFDEYSLGSAREARGWYFKCSLALSAECLRARMSLLTQIIRILTVVVPAERALKTDWRPRRTETAAGRNLDHPAVTSGST